MNCLEFQERLDTGDVASLDAAARAHAEGCAACRDTLERTVALEAALLADFREADEPASPGFVDRLMARVELAPQSRVAPSEIARATLAAFATPPIAAAAAFAAALLGVAAAYGFDPQRMATAATAAAAPAARLVDRLAAPLPATGLAHELTLAGVLCAVVPLFAVLLAGAWRLGNLIGERSPRAL